MRRSIRVGLWILVAVVIVGGLALHLLRGRLIRGVTTQVIEEITGFGCELDRVEVSLWKQTAEFTGLKLSNPEPFAEREAIEISRLYAELTWDAILGKRTWLRRLEIDIDSLTLIRPKEGLSNLEQLSENAERWQSRERDDGDAGRRGTRPVVVAGIVGGFRAAQIDTDTAAKETPEVQIDEFRLRLGVIHVVDYKLGRNEPVRFTQEVDQEKVYRDVTDLDALAEAISIDFTVDALADQLSEIEEVLPGFTEGLKGLLKEAAEMEHSEQGELEDPVEMFKDFLDAVQ